MSDYVLIFLCETDRELGMITEYRLLIDVTSLEVYHVHLFSGEIWGGGGEDYNFNTLERPEGKALLERSWCERGTVSKESLSEHFTGM